MVRMTRRDFLEVGGGSLGGLVLSDSPWLSAQPGELSEASADLGKPAPKWLREAGMFNGWYYPWSETMLERIRGCPLVVTATHTRDIVEKLHARKVRVVPYTNFFQPPTNIEREIERRQRSGKPVDRYMWEFRKSPFFKAMDPVLHHPEWIWVREDGYPWKNNYLIEEDTHGLPVNVHFCPNSVGFKEAVLAWVKEFMEMGMDGIFLDCVGAVDEKCHGPDFGRHRHLHPEWDGRQAWLDIQKDLYALVKSYGEDRVVLLNTSHRPEYLRSADAYMHESYIVTASRYRWQNWEKILQMKKEDEPALKAGKVILALSYVGYTPYGPDEDALYCYACARLFGYSWSDWFTLGDARATLLYRLQLGAVKSVILEYNGLLYRIFENGVVAVNPYKAERELRVKTGFNQGLRDVMTNRRYANADLQENLMQDLKGDEMYTPWPVDLWVTIPGESGRVYLQGDQEPE